MSKSVKETKFYVIETPYNKSIIDDAVEKLTKILKKEKLSLSLFSLNAITKKEYDTFKLIYIELIKQISNSNIVLRTDISNIVLFPIDHQSKLSEVVKDFDIVMEKFKNAQVIVLDIVKESKRSSMLFNILGKSTKGMEDGSRKSLELASKDSFAYLDNISLIEKECKSHGFIYKTSDNAKDYLINAIPEITNKLIQAESEKILKKPFISLSDSEDLDQVLVIINKQIAECERRESEASSNMSIPQSSSNTSASSSFLKTMETDSSVTSRQHRSGAVTDKPLIVSIINANEGFRDKHEAKQESKSVVFKQLGNNF